MSHTKPLHLGYDCDCDHVRNGEEEGLLYYPLEPLEHVPNLLNSDIWPSSIHIT